MKHCISCLIYYVKFKSRHNKWIFLAMTEIIVLILRNLHKVLSQTNLQHNLLHFFIRTLKLTNQDQHHFSGVVVGILCIHKRNQVPNGFEKSSKTLKKKRQHVRFKLFLSLSRRTLQWDHSKTAFSQYSVFVHVMDFNGWNYFCSAQMVVTDGQVLFPPLGMTYTKSKNTTEGLFNGFVK